MPSFQHLLLVLLSNLPRPGTIETEKILIFHRYFNLHNIVLHPVNHIFIDPHLIGKTGQFLESRESGWLPRRRN